jgi:predicted enzyme related to lactoylglutathione lyase
VLVVKSKILAPCTLPRMSGDLHPLGGIRSKEAGTQKTVCAFPNVLKLVYATWNLLPLGGIIPTMNIQKHTPGSFCCVELGTSDPAGAKKFYQSLFGWGFEDLPMGPDFIYTIFQSEGKDAAAVYKLMPDQVSRRVPPNWLSYVAVNNADDVARKAKISPASVNIVSTSRHI